MFSWQDEANLTSDHYSIISSGQNGEQILSSFLFIYFIIILIFNLRKAISMDAHFKQLKKRKSNLALLTFFLFGQYQGQFFYIKT